MLLVVSPPSGLPGSLCGRQSAAQDQTEVAFPTLPLWPQTPAGQEEAEGAVATGVPGKRAPWAVTWDEGLQERNPGGQVQEDREGLAVETEGDRTEKGASHPPARVTGVTPEARPCPSGPGRPTAPLPVVGVCLGFFVLSTHSVHGGPFWPRAARLSR